MHPYLEETLDRVRSRNPGYPVFLQAAGEILPTLEPLLGEYPEIEELNLLERFCEPERQFLFRVTWQDDDRRIRVNRGYRVGFSSVLGPFKGGLRFHPSVSLDIVRFLSFEQILKNSLTGLSLGGAKGGSDFDPRGRSDHEIMRFCQSFMTELHRHIGEQTDIPAGDIGVSQREIGFLFGQYKRLVNRYELGVITGKSASWGGSHVRKEATGYGVVFFAQAMLRARGDSLEGKTAVVSGSGNVALYTIRKLEELGVRVVSCSDSEGSLYAPGGIDFATLKQLKEVERGRLSAYPLGSGDTEYRPGQNVWDLPADLAFPCATENELDREDAERLVANGCFLVCEGANMPCRTEALEFFREQEVLHGPGKAANAGGVAVSALEMQQNAALEQWPFAEVEARLESIIQRIHDRCRRMASRYSDPDDYRTGANTAGFVRVVEAMRAFGF
jgi:glutamate dehydrogenase (NADP+)